MDPVAAWRPRKCTTVLARGRKQVGAGISESNNQLHDMGKGRHCPLAAVILCGFVDDEVAPNGKRSVHRDLIAGRQNCPKFVCVT